MSERSSAKAVIIGCASGLASLPLCAAICAAVSQKSGDLIEMVGVYAVICVVIGGAVGAFIGVRLGTSLTGVISTVTTSLILLASALLLSRGGGIFTMPLAALVGGGLVLLIMNIKRPKKRKMPKRPKRAKVRQS